MLTQSIAVSEKTFLLQVIYPNRVSFSARIEVKSVVSIFFLQVAFLVTEEFV